MSRFRHMAEASFHRFLHFAEENFLRFHGDGTGFNFGKIENVADQVQQVAAGGVDVTGKLNLFCGEIPVGIGCQLLRQDQN